MINQSTSQTILHYVQFFLTNHRNQIHNNLRLRKLPSQLKITQTNDSNLDYDKESTHSCFMFELLVLGLDQLGGLERISKVCSE